MYSEYDSLNVYLLKADIDTYNNMGFYTNGLNNILFITGKESGVYKIIQTILLNDEDSNCNSGISTLDCDTPSVSPSGEVWVTPSSIEVYFENQGIVDTVDFKYYCKVVTVCEVEEYADQPEAIKAVALAIKNYGWKRILAYKSGYAELARY